MTRSRKKYVVRFVECTAYRLDVEAHSPAEAVAIVQAKPTADLWEADEIGTGLSCFEVLLADRYYARRPPDD